eukprot:CAMPEP_0202731422 /NCGR_PEP_ID=MMETSP1385-20130828/187143_1 /ASSEMBLY_ACC=CAM_ASM_000861 /TAXON_ID=933848 /ORGANISM="Elphidium margaritaceum" /LENGTH=358 /DNA_ID=CAMNT_0049397719 /DNA_START=422 /DNA_END=1498 /DNA_ORIENTATION=-
MKLSQAYLLWQNSTDLFNATSYQYRFQHECLHLPCEECESASKYVTIDRDNVIDVSYDTGDAATAACAISQPIATESFSTYHTMSEWFELLSDESIAASTVTFDDKYGYPTTMTTGGDTYHIFCVSFMRHGSAIALNSADLGHCPAQHASILADGHGLMNNMTSPGTTNCADDVASMATTDHCTQWYYVYMTSGLSVVLSMLTIACFWLYYRQGLNPATKGYKRSLSYDNHDNESERSDSDDSLQQKNNNKKKKKKKSKKEKKAKKSKRNLFGIDENKQVAPNKVNKYGSVAAHSDEEDQEEKSDVFDLDDSERDDWHFIAADKRLRQKEVVHQQLNVIEAPNPFASSASDQTDSEEN